MIRDKDMKQRLNLLRSSPSFVFHETGEMGEADVLTIDSIPNDDGVYWVAGASKLKAGESLQSVFRVDTSSGGSLVSVYWWIKGNWYEHQDAEITEILGLEKSQLFPFDWMYAVKLEKDIYHD